MTKQKRGTKRLCESCGSKYYDLGRDPVVCPLCEAPLVLEKPKPKPEPKPEPEPEKVVVEPEVTAAPAPESGAPGPEPEFVSLEDAAEEEEADDEAKLADLGDDEVEIPPEDNQDAFLEEDEEDAGSDVSVIIGTPVKPKDDR
ncbi:MAG: TIGR02300 family protein [Methyloligellaceae bacterium]